MSLRRAEAIVHPRDSCDLDGRLSGSLASFKFAIGVRFKKDRSDSFRKDLAPRPILLFQKNEGMAKALCLNEEELPALPLQHLKPMSFKE
jgi:hypothetical protein